MDKTLIKVVWRKTLEDRLGLGKKMFIVVAIVITGIWVLVNGRMLHEMLEAMPLDIRPDAFVEFIKYNLFYMSIGIAFYMAWIFSFQLFTVEREEKIWETLLATPLNVRSIYTGKILGFVSVYIPLYFVQTLLWVLVAIRVGEPLVGFLPRFNMPLIVWLNALVIAPIIGIGICCVISLIQLTSRNPRLPPMVLLFLAMGYTIGIAEVKGRLEIDVMASIILAAVAIILVLVPVVYMLKVGVSNERMVLPG
ncbi:MAG: hypothetical protein DDT33_00466 [Firmicutes bacterium]|nr:hypothetical protein [Bacillota bacterium]